MASPAQLTPTSLLAGAPLAENARLRADDAEGWDAVWRKLRARPVAASAGMIDYMHAYLAGAAQWSLADASLVLASDGRPCGLWPLTLGGAAAATLTAQGEPIAPPLFAAGVSPRTIKRLVGECLDWLARASRSLGQETLLCREPPQPGFADDGLSEFYQQAWRRGADLARLRHDMYVDLEPELDEIRAGWRKSYRPLVTSGQRLWAVHVMDAVDPNRETWEAFVALHRKVAGRETRPIETWEHQRRMLTAGEALLVSLADAQGEMVGAGYFQITDREALYSVAAYDRSLFDKPLGHVVQARAIEEFKRRGLAWYKLGEMKFAGDPDRPNDKELSISAFKQGFASRLFATPVYSLRTDI
jgi:FemAB family protein